MTLPYLELKFPPFVNENRPITFYNVKYSCFTVSRSEKYLGKYLLSPDDLSIHLFNVFGSDEIFVLLFQSLSLWRRQSERFFSKILTG